MVLLAWLRSFWHYNLQALPKQCEELASESAHRLHAVDMKSKRHRICTIIAGTRIDWLNDMQSCIAVRSNAPWHQR